MIKLQSLIAKIRRRAVTLLRAVQRHIALLHPLRVVEAGTLLLLVTQLAVVVFNGASGSTPVLGLRLENQVVGQLDSSGFYKEVDSIINEYENKDLTIHAANTTSNINLRQLGVEVNNEQVYNELLKVGRSGNPLEQLGDQTIALVGARNVAIGHPNFNDDLAKAYIATINQKIEVAPNNAYFAYQNDQVVLRADVPGTAVDIDAALETLRNANPQRSTDVTLPTKSTTATVTAAMLEPLLPQVKAIAAKPLTIQAGDSKEVLSPEQLVGIIVPKITLDTNQNATAQISFDEAKLNAVVDTVVKRVVKAPEPTIMNGSKVVQQGKSGVQTEGGHTLEEVVTALVQRQNGIAAPDVAEIHLATVEPPRVQQSQGGGAAHSRTGTGKVRLTFDDGPGAHTEKILDILKRYNVHAMFYMIGRNVQSHPGTVRRMVNEGHGVGNHSFTHSDLSKMSRAGVEQEISKTQDAIKSACGVAPTAFRPPYGALNGTVRDVAASQGLSVDMWSVDPRDWAQPGSGAITKRVLSGNREGAVILLHVLHQQTVDALPSIIEGIRGQGYTLE